MKKQVLNIGFIKFKKRNVKLFGFFLIAAFFFLMLSKLSQTYTQEINLDVELYNLEDEIVVLNDTLYNGKVTVSAKGFNLLQYIFSNSKKIKIDAQQEAFKSKKQILWDLRSNRYQLKEVLGNTLEILSVSPDTIKFDYDVLSYKMVPIQLVKDVTYASGYDVVNTIRLSQDSVKIIGSKQAIDTINYVTTKAVVLKDVKSDILKSTGFVTNNTSIDIVPKQVDVNGEVKRFTEGKISIPVKLINAPIGKTVNFFPKQVDLVYYVDIDSFKGIKPEDFQVVCDFSNFKNSNTKSFDLEISKAPKQVKRSRLLQDKIEFVLSE
ncbi:CdaR family protein [Winogradskyella jejuensis]|uniref:YbbR-like protein n=1 Tax=Winogradskyella jejuensis TaxID=1089305 RepID=A0A1M5VNT0_9FLAO|nr:YbbR-like domain-containing protein [Winogradskyella jejuensis]SHH76887.1 hypothetical protein SAMN05444148_2767 [Winogradskyella jejuensis]